MSQPCFIVKSDSDDAGNRPRRSSLELAQPFTLSERMLLLGCGGANNTLTTLEKPKSIVILKTCVSSRHSVEPSDGDPDESCYQASSNPRQPSSFHHKTKAYKRLYVRFYPLHFVGHNLPKGRPPLSLSWTGREAVQKHTPWPTMERKRDTLRRRTICQLFGSIRLRGPIPITVLGSRRRWRS
jgi:hypothetical protein